MSENELDEILKQFAKKSDSDTDTNEKPFAVADNTDNIKREEYMDILSLVNENNRTKKEQECISHEQSKPKKKSQKPMIIIIALIIIAAIAVAGIFLAKSKEDTSEPTPQPSAPTEQVKAEEVLNPLTNEAGYNKAAIGKRPVAVVVENEYSTEAVRPQWAIDDADIVLEGESEFSTRMLFFWADYTDVPDMVGPTRSARPPFIRFSQLFDSIFIHAGLSKSKGSYIGADTVFQSENIDHINLLSLSEDGTYFGRNNERKTGVEHTGYLNGANLPKLLEEKDINTELNNESFTAFAFNEKPKALSDLSAADCAFKWSDSCGKTAKFTYDASSHKYVTKDFDSVYGESNAGFANLIFLFDETEYIVKEDYKNGQSETYCDYKLSGGSGTILSEGTALEITWGVADSKLWIKTLDGKPVALNTGKSYIGYGSSNHGGSLELNPTTDTNE